MGCGCLIALLAWLSPRFVMILLQIFTDRLAIAFDSFIIGALGFVFLPYTAVFYALAFMPPNGLGQSGVSGFGWILVAAGFLLDISSWVNSGMQAQSRQSAA